MCIRRYIDTAVDTVMRRMTPEEKTEYWHGIEDAFINKLETSWTKTTLIRKLQRQVANIRPMIKEPSKKASKQEIEEKPDSSTREGGKIVTLKRRKHLQEFHDHMRTLNKERKEMDIKIKGERKVLAALMKIPRRATV